MRSKYKHQIVMCQEDIGAMQDMSWYFTKIQWFLGFLKKKMVKVFAFKPNQAD